LSRAEIAAEIYRMSDAAGCPLADPDSTVRRWLGYAEDDA
jgi:hypothetical protein